jgi:hypothetical protein
LQTIPPARRDAWRASLRETKIAGLSNKYKDEFNTVPLSYRTAFQASDHQRVWRFQTTADAKRHLQSAAIELDHTSCPTGVIEKLISRSDRS